MQNFIDKLIDYVSPKAAFERNRYRTINAAYEAAKPTPQRKERPDNSGANLLTQKAGANIRGYARNLEQNYDIAESVLTTMINNVVGANGISIEPTPRRKDGTLHTEFSKQLLALWNNFKECPDVSHEYRWSQCERLICRTWLRDGEAFMQYVAGTINGFQHGTKIPLSVELIEADYLPFWNNDASINLSQSIQRNGWGRPIAYHVLKQHPQDLSYQYNSTETRVIYAQNMAHIKLTTRFKQSRGVSIFATVMKRIEDIKDYEESERIAARIAAAWVGFIKRGEAQNFDPSKTSEGFSIKPGMIWDNLTEGEDIGTIQSNRPSGLLEGFRDAMVRAVAGGTGGNYSSISKKYDGNYSAQRQELVESYGNYSVLTDSFAGAITLPTYKKMVEVGIIAGLIKPPADLDMDTLFECEFYGPKMPWVDPLKEIRANSEAVSSGFKSPQQVIRDGGNNPDAVMEQTADWQAKASAKNLTFTTSVQSIDNTPA
jgi:lambda family phage portal protein